MWDPYDRLLFENAWTLFHFYLVCFFCPDNYFLVETCFYRIVCTFKNIPKNPSTFRRMTQCNLTFWLTIVLKIITKHGSSIIIIKGIFEDNIV